MDAHVWGVKYLSTIIPIPLFSASDLILPIWCSPWPHVLSTWKNETHLTLCPAPCTFRTYTIQSLICGCSKIFGSECRHWNLFGALWRWRLTSCQGPSHVHWSLWWEAQKITSGCPPLIHHDDLSFHLIQIDVVSIGPRRAFVGVVTFCITAIKLLFSVDWWRYIYPFTIPFIRRVCIETVRILALANPLIVSSVNGFRWMLIAISDTVSRFLLTLW